MKYCHHHNDRSCIHAYLYYSICLSVGLFVWLSVCLAVSNCASSCLCHAAPHMHYLCTPLQHLSSTMPHPNFLAQRLADPQVVSAGSTCCFFFNGSFPPFRSFVTGAFPGEYLKVLLYYLVCIILKAEGFTQLFLWVIEILAHSPVVLTHLTIAG